MTDDNDKSDSLTSSDDSTKSVSRLHSLVDNLANLNLMKCSDGINCGTDDEDAESTKKHVETSNSKPEGSKDVDRGSRNEATGEQGSEDEKKTLVDYLAENMNAIVDEEMFAVIPLPWCPHLESLFAIPSDIKFEQGMKCIDCDHTVENWVCLHCYVVSIKRCL